MTIVVAGCVAQAEGEEVFRRAPFVDIVVGPQSIAALPELIVKASISKGHVINTDFPEVAKFDKLPDECYGNSQGSSAFLSIQEGCDKFCTFCVVPYTRGTEYSRPVTDDEKTSHKLIDLVNPLLKRQNPEECTTETACLGGGYGWVIVACSFCCSMIVDGAINSSGIFLSELVKEFEESEGRISYIGSILGVGPLLSAPLGSAISNTYGCRVACVTGGLVTSTSFALSVFSPTVTWLMVANLFASMGLGLIYGPSLVHVGYYFKSKRKLATGLAESGSGFGTCIIPPFVNYVVQTTGWKAGTLCIAAITLISVFSGILMRPVKKNTATKETYNESKLKSAVLSSAKDEQNLSMTDVSLGNMEDDKLYLQKPLSGTSPTLPNEDYAQNSEKKYTPILDFNLLKDTKFILLAVMNIFATIVYFIPFLFIVECAKSDNVGVTQASFLISITGITYTIAQVFFGYITDFPMVSSLFVNNLCMLMGTIAVGSISICVSYTSYAFAAVCFGFAAGGYVGLIPITITDIFGLEKLSSAFGFILGIKGVGTFFGLASTGALLDATHSYKIIFLVGGGLYLIATILGSLLQILDRKRTVTDGYI